MSAPSAPSTELSGRGGNVRREICRRSRRRRGLARSVRPHRAVQDGDPRRRMSLNGACITAKPSPLAPLRSPAIRTRRAARSRPIGLVVEKRARTDDLRLIAHLPARERPRCLNSLPLARLRRTRRNRPARLQGRAGEIVGILGPNGAGKTTLFNMIAGVPPSAGRILFANRDITAIKAWDRCASSESAAPINSQAVYL